ncbi:helix-turn-helix domain-containing protein [Runella sp.]|uniref:helix-turn-helix domain-containing protein n=1 Tax=Runella sp. TaxID=1960881 RepID=UPI0026299D69|nr:helix-turn-helix transcriptional regulator [Runella sp.]
MSLVQRIKEVREAKKLSQSEVANALNMERSNYHRLENRGEKLTIEQLESIAGALGVSVVELLTGEPEAVENDERVTELVKRVEELEDRVKDKQFKIDAIEREAKIFRELVFETLSEAVGHSDKLESYVQVIESNKWLIPLLSGIPYNSLKLKEYAWKEYWSKAIEIVINRIWDLVEDDKEPDEELLTVSTHLKRKYRRNRDMFKDPKFGESYEDVSFLVYYRPTGLENDIEGNEPNK